MRKAVIIPMGEFQKKVSAMKAKQNDFYSSTIMKDLSKIRFDWENQEDEESDWNKDDGNGNPLGYKFLKNGLPVLYGWAGGDWEWPVSFILYWDGRKIRGYIPEEGNTFDKKWRTAWGSQGEAGCQEDIDDDNNPNKIDRVAMENDILSRIKIVEK